MKIGIQVLVKKQNLMILLVFGKMDLIQIHRLKKFKEIGKKIYGKDFS